MAKEESLKSKSLYKLLLIMLKYIPMLIALFYVINTATAYIGIDIPVLSNIAGMSLSYLDIYVPVSYSIQVLFIS